MKTCENHNECIVVFNEDVCPFCRAEKKLKTIAEIIEKSMPIMKEIEMAAQESGQASN